MEKIYFKLNLDISKNSNTNNYNNLDDTFLNIAKNATKEYYRNGEGAKDVILSSEQKEDLKTSLLADHSKSGISYTIETFDATVMAINDGGHLPKLDSWSLKSELKSQIYELLTILDEHLFVCINPLTNEIVFIEREDESKVFIQK